MKEQAKRPPREKVIIGAAEYVRLPDWRIGKLRAKVDTGARSSALHVQNVEVLPKNRVAFEVVLGSGDEAKTVRVEADVSRQSEVRSSNGKTEKRIFVKTALQIGPVTRDVEISLTRRGNMRYRMLLGRTALRGPFLVDPGRRYVATKGSAGKAGRGDRTPIGSTSRPSPSEGARER